MLRKLFILFFFSILTTYCFSQNVRKFDDDVEKYPEAVAEMFTVNITEDELALIARFKDEWSSGTFTNDEKIEIVLVSNCFLEKRARNIHYWMFWRCLLLFKNPENSGNGYDVWMKALYAECQDRRTQPSVLQTLMTATLDLLDKQLIYSSAGNDWKCSNKDYRFEYINEQLTIIVGNCDLYCYSRGDSIMIRQTSGRFSMSDQMWKGKSGTVTWERAGYAQGEVSAKLGNYAINMKQTQYEADSVWLTHSVYFPSPVPGKLIDRVQNIPNPEAARYPEFITNNKKFAFSNLYPNVDFVGGVTIQGARIIGAGTDEEKAAIKINKDDTLRMDIESKNFVFFKDRITARNVLLNIRMDHDSIFHHSLSFQYLVDRRELDFTRSDAASSMAPYNNSYHKVNMDFDQLLWKTEEPMMSLSTVIGSAGGRAQFRSQNFFDRRYYEGLQYGDANHPLVSLWNCSLAERSRTFSVETYARHIRRSVSAARVQLIEIAKLGFILFNGDKDEATLLPQLNQFLAAAAQQVDFDVIDLRSSVVAPTKNAMFNIHNQNLFINGIEQFMVSDSQQVIITPRGQQVMMRKNRALRFDGRVDAGQAEMYGELMHFDYSSFSIDLTKIDSLYFHVPTGERDGFGRPRMQRLKTAITKFSGNVLIDQPNNKSGRKSLREYPILNGKEPAFVYYNSPGIAGGVYDSESFYFEVDPFVIANVDNLPKDSIALKGKFVSAEIFTDMRQTLLVQPDYSLGFTHEADSAVTTYNKAQLYAEIRLSNRGLKAGGKLDYLTASIHAPDINLFPDSMNVPVAKEFTIRKQVGGVEFPDVRSEGNRIHWEPKNDQMFIYKKDKNFDMYNPETQFDGSLLLTPRGLTGKGRMDMGLADIRSDKFDFKANKFTADSSIFRLRAVKDGPVQLTSNERFHSEIDFDTRKGRFMPGMNQDYSLIQFPANKFAAHIEGMIWDMDNAQVHIGAVPTGRPLKPAVDFKYKYPGESLGTRYYSTDRNADSLNFVATQATYDMNLGTLKAEGVTLVKTADAVVFPGEGKLTVNAEGQLEQIQKAKIVFNDVLKQHTIYDADVKINSRRQYSGSGKYDYTDETGKVSVINMPKVEADRFGKTTATGVITKEDEFMLSPFFRYHGNMTLLSAETFPVFEGVAQIVEECGRIHPHGFRFKSPIEPDSVRIIVDEAPVNENFNKIYNGMFLTNDSVHIYPAFFSGRRTYSDHHLITASGTLTYDKDSMTYFIASDEKLRSRDTTGNLLAYNRDRCLLSGEGRISTLGMNLGRVKTDVVGRITHNMNDHETSMDVMMSLDFLFDDELAKIIAEKIGSTETLTGVDMQRQIYIRGMNEWLGMKKAETYRRDAALGKVTAFPEELKKTLVLTHLRLRWNQSNRSWRSVGKIGVGNLYGHQVNRFVDGMVEIIKRTGGDEMNIYLKLDNSNWFYFGYTREMMQVISSDQTFNDRLVKLPSKVRKMQGRPNFTFMICSRDKLGQFQRQYQQIEPTLELSSPPSGSQGPVSPPVSPTPTPAPATPTVNTNEDEVPIIEVE